MSVQEEVLEELLTQTEETRQNEIVVFNEVIYAATQGGSVRYANLNNPNLIDFNQWQQVSNLGNVRNISVFNNEVVAVGNGQRLYEINPNDPDNGGNHNHKGFSVYVVNDTVWAGTANGINKGILESDCINWEHHYTSKTGNETEMGKISGNWVIGFNNQKLDNGTERFWAITWAGDGSNEKHALSYTENGGENWAITYPSGYSEKVYNLYANENRIWAATASGLFDGNIKLQFAAGYPLGSRSILKRSESAF